MVEQDLVDTILRKIHETIKVFSEFSAALVRVKIGQNLGSTGKVNFLHINDAVFLHFPFPKFCLIVDLL